MQTPVNDNYAINRTETVQYTKNKECLQWHLGCKTLKAKDGVRGV